MLKKRLFKKNRKISLNILRLIFIILIIYFTAAGTATLVAGKQIVVSIVQFLLPPKDVVAAAKIEVDLTQIPEGMILAFA